MQTTNEAETTKRTKIVRIGKIDIGLNADLFCKIELDNQRLLITGAEGPKSNGDAWGGCGQIVMSDWRMIDYAPGWDADLVSKFRTVWNRWHLNDMRAGSPAQERWLRENPIPEAEYAYPKSHYDVASVKLATAGLNPDGGYLYGDAWNVESVPDDVIKFLFSLPDADTQPAWV